VQVALENQRVVLMKAKQDESVLLKLKDRHYAYWLEEEARRERRQMDEAGARMMRYVS
jgi:flagellar export protein FliJ